MRHRTTIEHIVYRAIVAGVLVALVFGTSAYATPSGSQDASESVPPTQPETPDESREPTESVIPVPIDEETAAFRAELARRQARLDDLKSQLEELDTELSIATEAYNAAILELELTELRLQAARIDLDNAENAFSIQSAQLEEYAGNLYRNEGDDVLETLLDAKSIGDLIDRIRYLQAMGEEEADLVAKLEAERDRLAATADELQAAEREAQSLEFTLEARRIEILLRMEERRQLLASAETDLLALLDDEAARRQQEEARLMRDILSGATGVGIDVVPRSPVETALAYHGVPYLWGGSTPSGFDCSGFVMYVFAQHGVALPHYSGAQFLRGEKVPPSGLRAGDVVFFGSPVHHVGIYLGNGYFIHAPRTGDFVKVSRLADRSDYAGARRYVWGPRTEPIKGAPAVNIDIVQGIELRTP